MSAFDLLRKGLSLSRKDHSQIKAFEQTLRTDRPKAQPFSAQKYQSDDKSQDQEPLSKAALKRLGLSISGEQLPRVATDFTQLIKRYGISKYLLRNLASMGILKPTPVQMAVPPLMLEGRSVIATSSTGSGKTCAFALPLLHLLKDHQEGGPRAVVFCHAHELGLQLCDQLSKLSERKGQRRLVVGRVDNCSVQSVDVLISTPLRFSKDWDPNTMARLEWVVLDQSDKYFEDSFAEQITEIIELVKPLAPKFVLLSATFQHPVQKLLEEGVMEGAVRVRVGKQQNTSLSCVAQSLQYCATEQGKMVFLKNLILEGKLTPPALLFCQSKDRARQLTSQLRRLLGANGQSSRVQSVHADKQWQVRERLLQQFQAGQIWLLVGTDLVARGIDFKRVNMVINYDFPSSPVNYVHRVGRTGRNGRSGTAITLFTDQDRGQVRALASLLRESGCEPPDWLLRLKKRKRQKQFYVDRQAIRKDLRRDPGFFEQKRRMDGRFFSKLSRQKEGVAQQ